MLDFRRLQLVGERGFEPPAPASRTKLLEAFFAVFGRFLALTRALRPRTSAEQTPDFAAHYRTLTTAEFDPVIAASRLQ